MTLAQGTRLGPYEIAAAIGAGAMGEVYRARDTTLGRDIAIKVLPAEVAQDPERLARFEREARLLASLNHPNIAHVYGFESAAMPDGSAAHFLAMELVAGEGLGERLKRGAIPVDEVIAIGRQISEALEVAHEKGIVHRDLKPANIMVTPDANVKVLDFGLARADTGGSSTSSPDLSESPTLAHAGTRAGLILGSAAYMSPEQARGKTVDRRADVWAFGVVLWEMVTGRRLFDGETVTDVLAAVLTREPEWRGVEDVAGAEFARVLRGCLTRDPRQRFSSASDVALLLENALQGTAPPPSAPRPERTGRRFAVALLGAGVAAGLVIGAGIAWKDNPGAVTAGVERFSIVDPNIVAPAGVAISPDGRRLALTVERDEGSVLAVRSLDRFDPVRYPGTEGAMCPFFSPDGAWIGYFTRTELRKVPITGGQPRTIASFGASVRFDPWNAASYPTADWGADDTIVFSSGFWRQPATLPGLFMVPGSGGQPRPLTNLDGKELGHRSPSFTPDGRHIVFTVLGSGPRNTHVDLIERQSGRRRRLQVGAALGRVLPSGYFVHADAFYSRLAAAAIDLTSFDLTGPSVPLIEGVSTTPSQSFAVSPSGTLVYFAAGAGEGQSRLVRVGLGGSVTALVDRAGSWYQPRTSPDGRHLVVREVGDECRLWLYDLERRTLTPLTSSGDNHQPVWMRSGQEVVYGREDAGVRGLFRHVADGSRPPVLLLSGKAVGDSGSASVPYPDSFSPGDRALLFERSTLETGSDLWVAPMDGRVPEPFLASPAFEGDGAFSPDGSWVAYVSDESGRQEVYVRGYPGKGGRTQLSVAGGEWPIWSRDGSRLYFSQGRRLMAVDFSGKGQEAAVSRPKEVLAGFGFGRGNFDLMPDGKSLVLVEPAMHGLVEVRVVSGWTRELFDLVPTGARR